MVRAVLDAHQIRRPARFLLLMGENGAATQPAQPVQVQAQAQAKAVQKGAP